MYRLKRRLVAPVPYSVLGAPQLMCSSVAYPPAGCRTSTSCGQAVPRLNIWAWTHRQLVPRHQCHRDRLGRNWGQHRPLQKSSTSPCRSWVSPIRVTLVRREKAPDLWPGDTCLRGGLAVEEEEETEWGMGCLGTVRSNTRVLSMQASW